MLARRPTFFLAPLLILALTTGLPALPVSAQSARWERIGPEGGFVIALAASPSRPGIVYAWLSPGGVYRSSDRGFTWTYAGRGLATGGAVDALGVDATSARTVYAVQDKLFKTEDSGASWRPVD
ncbi:MAG: WD40/YVTN/BNR-like repeat-containing protein, partial [Thermoanaerobaculia bacterium]